MTMGQKIQFLRRQRGWSQEMLANQLSVSRQALSKWELGTSLPDTVNVRNLSRLFAVSADYLLDDTIDTPEDTRSQNSAVVVPFKLSKRVVRLIDEKGYAAFFILSGASIPPLLFVCFICFGYLSVLSTFAPLREYPIQAFIIPIFAGILGILIIIRAVVFLILAIRLKRLQNRG